MGEPQRQVFKSNDTVTVGMNPNKSFSLLRIIHQRYKNSILIQAHPIVPIVANCK